MGTTATASRLLAFPCPAVRDRIQRQGRMSVSSARAHFRGDPDSFHDLFGRRPVPHGGACMAADTIRALRHMRDGHRDQLLRLRGNGTFSEYALAERPEGLGRPGGQTILCSASSRVVCG